jgi:DNA-directed RNA polymerase specialized sigma24 family protein
VPADPVDVDLLRAIGQLPAHQRAAVVLFYSEDRPVSELADLSGCTQSAAKVWLHRGHRHRCDADTYVQSACLTPALT